MKTELRHFWIATKRLYKTVLGFREDTDVEQTIAGIQRDISFRGHTAWILMFSILIASIGLNVNSTAVVIGAMLISPLMGPILGIGLSVGTNDYTMLMRSFKNFGIAVGISLVTSTAYFLLTPLNIEQTELIARTEPTLLDVLVAIFGGFAGIIAGSRKEKSNVVPGVAIATALMPPLCTAGYGLANWRLDYFFGASYLFFINSVFISLSTFLVVRYLRFPMVQFVSKYKMKKYRTVLIVLLIVTIAPSTFTFYNVIQETRFAATSEAFINEKCIIPGSELLSYKVQYNDTLSRIDLYYIGKEIERSQIDYLESELKDYGLISDKWYAPTKRTEIQIHQEAGSNINIEEKLSEMNNNLRIKILEDIYNKNEEKIRDKDEKIKLLEEQVMKLSARDTIDYTQISKEMMYHFPIIEKYSYGQAVEASGTPDSMAYDTIPVFLIKMNARYRASHRKKQLKEAEEWLRVRLNRDNIRTIEY